MNKRLHFCYDLQIAFSSPITNHSFTIKCIPASDERQKISVKDTVILPKESLSFGTDSFGNNCVFGTTHQSHSLFKAYVEGTADITNVSCPAPAPHMLGAFLSPTHLTEPGNEIRKFFTRIPLISSAGNYAKGKCIMENVYRALNYRAGATNIDTTAEEALSLRCGVCQDYSHIMLSLCRLAKIPSRYVVGMLIGEGKSHAWVEVEDGGFWYGLDPTNNQEVECSHIKISHGRDYKDCIINQGIFTGTASQTQSISVNVREI